MFPNHVPLHWRLATRTNSPEAISVIHLEVFEYKIRKPPNLSLSCYLYDFLWVSWCLDQSNLFQIWVFHLLAIFYWSSFSPPLLSPLFPITSFSLNILVTTLTNRVEQYLCTCSWHFYLQLGGSTLASLFLISFSSNIFALTQLGDSSRFQLFIFVNRVGT